MLGNVLSFRMNLFFLVLLVTFLVNVSLILVDVTLNVPITYQVRLIAMLAILVCVIVVTKATKSKDEF